MNKEELIVGEIGEYKELHIRVKCPDCERHQFQDEEAVGMTPCLSCNSTGYIYRPFMVTVEVGCNAAE